MIAKARGRQNEAIAKKDFQTATTFWTQDVSVRAGLGRSLQSEPASKFPYGSAMSPSDREQVEFITTEIGDDLIVAFAIGLPEAGEIVSLILQRTPMFEGLLPPEERGVAVSHERFIEEDRELVVSIVVDGSHVDIETSTRTYRVDLSAVDPEEVADARTVLRLMDRHGGFKLDLR